MPELPEVETVRLQLLHKVGGKTIKKVTVHHPKSVDHNQSISQTLKHKTISTIDRVGKLMIISFEKSADTFLLAHLKMTGQFFFVDNTGTVAGGGHSLTEADTKSLPNKHTRVTFYFTDDTALHFNDMRLFGYIKVATAAEVVSAKQSYGQEPIASDFDTQKFQTGLKRRTTIIKAALLDQSFVAGLGNIYVDETLWHAKILPTRRSNSLTTQEALSIAQFAGEIMSTSINVGGTTFQHFVDTGGNNGNYSDYLKVFGKQNTPCPRCDTIIKKIRCAGRGTHYCPGCQK
jgi:formamidopyrimidine-DNA glycosylase